jgi:hydrogenase-4 component F
MEIFFILGIPLCLAALAFLLPGRKSFSRVNAFGYVLILAASVSLIFHLFRNGAPLSLFHFFYVDSLSAFFIFTISVVTLASSLYSIDYIAKDMEAGAVSEKKAAAYYGLFNLFSFTMFFVPVVDNLGVVWVAIEMTTLVSAFLVGFYNNKKSIEAAWKYIIICSVGISLALLGTILVYYTTARHGGVNSLNWTEMMAAARRLDPQTLKIAFLFLLVGYGTKAGLVPMHTWLPDAHSQALAPISALLSGVLLKTALYALLRYTAIINRCIGSEYSGGLLIFFGLLSLGLSAAFILVQKDVKRLLAYHSVEHMGIISVGIGFGGTLGLYGALFHILNHAVTKSLMFFGAGDIVKKYETNDMSLIRGVLGAMPFTGVVLILGTFALAGSPPFSIFMSEIMILLSGFKEGHFLPALLFILFVAVIFGAIIHHFSRVIFGRKPAAMTVSRQPWTGKIAFVFLLIFICVLGLTLPGFLNRILISAVDIIRGA